MVENIGVKSFFSKGKDIKDIEKKMRTAIQYTKKNYKPAFIEIKTTRWLEHCGPNNDDNLAYRSKKVLNEWKDNDFLKKFDQKITNHNYYKSLKKKIDNEINKAFNIAEKSKFPNFADLKKGVYE